MSTKWYNILPGINCVFAMDYDCPINNDGTIINYSNDNSKVLSVINNITDKVYKAEFSAYKTKDFKYLLDMVYRYKALRVDNINFRAPDPIVLPENCTIIFVGKVESTSVFMDTDMRGGSHGLSISSLNNSSYDNYWRVSSAVFRSSHNQSLIRSIRFGAHMDTVILKGNKFTKNVECITSYGTIKHRGNAYIDQSVPHFSYIGYRDQSNNHYKPDAYIVAYGVFDKQLSNEEINTVLQKIDDQFLVKSYTSPGLNLSNKKFSEYVFDMNLVTPTPKILETKPYNILDSYTTVRTECYIKDININEYGEIKDYIYEEEEPIATKLFLIDRESGQYIATTFSSSNGYFEFKNIDKSREYLVVAPHLNYQFRAITKDYILGSR